MGRLAAAAAALSAALLLSGCFVEYQVPYHETAETFSIDPLTGHLIRTTFWKTTQSSRILETRDDITANGPENRRGPQPEHGFFTLD